MARGSGSRARKPPLTVSRAELLEGGSDGLFRAMVQDLVAFAGRLQEIRGALARQMSVTAPQYNLLMSLAHGGDGETVKEIAGRLRVSVPFVVTESRRLEERGWIERRDDPADGRRVKLVLTAAAHAGIGAIAPAQRAVNDVLFGSLDRERFVALATVAAALLASCDEALAQAATVPDGSDRPVARAGRVRPAGTSDPIARPARRPRGGDPFR